MIVDNSVSQKTTPTPSKSANEVVIVSNETNKTHVNESSDDDCCPSLDSLEYPPPSEFRDKPLKKLDESEVLIVDSNYVINDSGLDVSDDNSRLADTSHVSVVKIDEEKVQVKDSSASFGYGDTVGSTSDLSNTSSSKGGSMKSDFGEEMKSTSIILDNTHGEETGSKFRMNGQVVHSPSRGNMNGKSYGDSFESAVSDSRSHSDSGSIRSSDSHRRPISKQSDVESISLASHDSRGSNGKETKSDQMSEMGKKVCFYK